MRFLLSVLALFLFATLSFAGNCRYASSAPVILQQQVYQSSQVTYTQQVPVLAPAPVCTYASSAQAFVPSYAPAYIPQEQIIVKRRVFAAPAPVYAPQAQIGYGGYGAGLPRQVGFAGGGFGGGPLRQGFQTGGILGAAERLSGLGDGSGQVGTGVILGLLGARANIFGLGGRR